MYVNIIFIDSIYYQRTTYIVYRQYVIYTCKYIFIISLMEYIVSYIHNTCKYIFIISLMEYIVSYIHNTCIYALYLLYH